MTTASTPARGAVFRYEGYQIDPAHNQLTCNYSLDGASYAEVVTFPGGGDWTQPAVDEAARWVYLLAGVSYYKTAAPPVVDLGDTALTDSEQTFLHEFYVDGLGEFAYRNTPRLDLTDLKIVGPVLTRTGPSTYTPQHGRRPLIPFGGGVDSTVTVELIKPDTDQAALFVVTRPGDRFEAIEEPAKVTGLPVVRAERLIDNNLLTAKPGQFFNGHVPVTGIISAITVLAALLGGHDAVVMSNEWSASVGTIEVDGRSINHQYSKGESFESGFRAVLADAIGTDFDYFSLLRPYTEFWIADRFAQLPEYFSTFRSCNRSFHIDPAKRLDHWCGHCDKCCFIDLILAPFLPADTLRGVFTRTAEPLDNIELLPKFLTLVGLVPDTKPWECVGDINECRAATRVSAARPDRSDSPILTELMRRLPDEGPLDVDHLMRPVGHHHIPERYAPADLLV